MIISGKQAFEVLKKKLKKEIDQIKLKKPLTPTLVAIQIGSNAASEKYLQRKQITLSELDCSMQIIQFDKPDNISAFKNLIQSLNEDKSINGIIIQLPLPTEIKEKTQELLDLINPYKDVDCLTSTNLGHFFSQTNNNMMPATVQGIIDLLDFYNIELEGKNVVIINRSNLIGKPLAIKLLSKNATVTVCHSKTKKLKKFTKNADIVVSAIGKSKILDSSYFKDNQVLIDIGISIDPNTSKLSGDIDFEDVVNKRKVDITPVPGGVGPMTIYGLIKNLIYLTKRQIDYND